MRRFIFIVVALTLALSVPALAQSGEEATQSETTQAAPVTLDFELRVTGRPPAGATFFGQVGAGMRDVRERLTDPDGDGIYTGSLEYVSGGREGVVILQGNGVTQGDDGSASPGAPETAIRDFGSTAIEGDRTFSATASFGDDGAATAGPISATGVLQKPRFTTYMYGTHAITDEDSATPFALASESVDLDDYVGEEVTVYGAPVPGYARGEVEGGPALLEVGEVAPAGGPEDEARVRFELSIEGEVPDDHTFRVESSIGEGEAICTTDPAVAEEEGSPGCLPDEVNTADVLLPAGEPFDYRVLRTRGTEVSSFVLEEGSEVAEDGLIVPASYSAENDPASGEDLNEDGEINEADGELAIRTSEAADAATGPDEKVLPDTGGPALAPAASLVTLAAWLLVRRVRARNSHAP